MDLETPLRPLVAQMGLELYDVEFSGGTLLVSVTKEGGVDVETLAKANRAISAWLDEKDPIAGRFTLDVASPGLERRLRTSEHFRLAIGEEVTLRQVRRDEPTRRLQGVVTAVSGDEITLTDQQVGEVVVHLDQVERARTVFEWGATAKPSPSRARTATKE